MNDVFHTILKNKGMAEHLFNSCFSYGLYDWGNSCLQTSQSVSSIPDYQFGKTLHRLVFEDSVLTTFWKFERPFDQSGKATKTIALMVFARIFQSVTNKHLKFWS